MTSVVQRLDCGFVRLGAADLDCVRAIEACAFSTPWGEEQLLAALTRKPFVCFGLRAAPQPPRLAAYCAFYHVAGEMEICKLATAPDLRRQGLARMLLDRVLSIGNKLGVEKAFLEVRQGNAAAQNLYLGMGFVQVGARPGYYEDTGEDALLLCKQLKLLGETP